MQNQTPIASPVARTLSVIEIELDLLILRDFFLHGPRRFQQLQELIE